MPEKSYRVISTYLICLQSKTEPETVTTRMLFTGLNTIFGQTFTHFISLQKCQCERILKNSLLVSVEDDSLSISSQICRINAIDTTEIIPNGNWALLNSKIITKNIKFIIIYDIGLFVVSNENSLECVDTDFGWRCLGSCGRFFGHWRSG